MAGLYITEEFKKLKLKQPGTNTAASDFLADNLRYMQPLPYIADIALGKSNDLRFWKEGALVQLKVDQDWTPLGFSANGKIIKAVAVFAGYGIADSGLKYDDYAGLDAKGKVVLAFAGTPDGNNPHGQFARYADARFKAAIAKDKGAAALLIIANEEKFTDDRLSSLKTDYTPNDAGLPVAAISRQAAAQMFGLASSELSNIEEWWPKRNEPQSGVGFKKQFQVRSLENVTINLETELVRKNAPAYNVIGILEGSDPKLKNEAIVIGAHYDHLGTGGAGSLAEKMGGIHYGADDNASGVAGLLELARIFSANRKQIRRSIVFIAFSGEEEGLIGSSYYVNHPVFPLDQTIAMINMDMIGRLKDNKLTIGGIGTASEWKELIQNKNARKAESATLPLPSMIGGDMAETKVVVSASIDNFTLQLNEDGFGPSDHSSFYGKQVPVLFFFTGTHDDYHKPSDTADKINYEGEASVVSFVADIIRALDQNDKRPTYTVAKSSSTSGRTGFNVYLGTIPNYADSNDGLLLDGVREDSPAAKAGLKAGDKVVKLAGREIKNVYDYTYALGEMKAGVEYEVEVMRDGKRLTLKLTPSARK